MPPFSKFWKEQAENPLFIIAGRMCSVGLDGYSFIMEDDVERRQAQLVVFEKAIDAKRDLLKELAIEIANSVGKVFSGK